METTSSHNSDSGSAKARHWVAYVAPMAVFLALTALEGYAPGQYVWLYIAKVVVVTATLIACRATWRDIKPEGRVLLPAIVVGLAVFAEWILVDPVTPHLSLMGRRAEFNPFAAIHAPALRGLFLAFRFFGLTVMVPVMEELFWRSFLLRYLTQPDWESLPVGAFSWTAFALVAAGFGLAHPEWLAAILCAVAYGLLLRQTRSLFACVVAHAVTNLALGLYVLQTHLWRFW